MLLRRFASLTFCFLALTVARGEAQTAAVSDDQTVSIHSIRKDSVEVDGRLQAVSAAEAGQFTLGTQDLVNLSSVLADDPFRALQAAPGVTTNDDFEARFSLRGAGFSRIGVYLDGIQLPNAMHRLQGTDLAGSASVFNPALVNELQLYSGTSPVQYANASAGVVDVALKDANYDRYSFRFAANFGSAGATASGPLGRVKNCSWIAGFRKSYLQAILPQSASDPSMMFGIEDETGHGACRAGDSNRFTLDLLQSGTDLNRSSIRKDLGPTGLLLSQQSTSVANFGWLYTPHDNFSLTTHLAYIRDSFNDVNADSAVNGRGLDHEAALGSNVTWVDSTSNTLQAGVDARRMTADGTQATYLNELGVTTHENWAGDGWLHGGFVEDTQALAHGRVRASVGGRWERNSIDGVTAFLPHGSLALNLLKTTVLQFAWGQYAQFPGIESLTSNLGALSLLPSRSSQMQASIRQQIGAHFSVKAEFYNRQDRDLLFQPWLEPRLVDNALFVPPLAPTYANSERGYARGAEFTLQRDGSARLSGWLSYAYGRTNMRDGVSGSVFSSDYDQRHTANSYLTYRWRPTVNLSARWSYGSGFPAPGYFRVVGPVENQIFFLDQQRNRVRIGPYQRLDLRINKEWRGERWKRTLYAEVTNVTDKANYRFGSTDGYAPSHFAYVTVDQLFPILPTVGFVLER